MDPVRPPARSAPLALAAAVAMLACSGDPTASTPAPAHVGAFAGIDAFLDTCPAEDPAMPRILADFGIWRDGVRVRTLACSGPVAGLPIEEWTQELVLAQTLRTIYYLRGAALPWTERSLYDWLRENVGGFEIVTGSPGSSCCRRVSGERPRIRYGDAPDAQREFDRRAEGIFGNVALLVHETRHLAGYAHVDCCAVGASACDRRYDEADLSAYAAQRWVTHALATGALETGYGCLEAARVASISGWLRREVEDAGALRFCEDAPDLPVTAPSCAPALPFESRAGATP